MDQGSSPPPEVHPPIAEQELQFSELHQSEAFNHLCEWFDGELQLLAERFAEFQTRASTKAR